MRTRARVARVLRYADWAIRKDLLSKGSQFHFSIKKILALVFLQPTCRFGESDVSFCGKQRVVLLE